MSTFLDWIAERTVLCDGAMGTALHAAGTPLDAAIPVANLTGPDLVREIHSTYIAAGADIVQTNTFGANRLRLAPHGHADGVREINAAGVALARAAASTSPRTVLVAGSVSPPVGMHQRRDTTSAERLDAVAEQIEALEEAGIDLLVLETFGHLDDLVEAIAVAAEHSGVPVVAQATFRNDGRTLSGHTPYDLAEAVRDAPIALLGVNCTLGPQGTHQVLTQLAEHTTLRLSAQPNAGLPRRSADARLEYEMEPDYFGRYAARAADVGAVLVGGCCGTTPLHIAAAARALRHRRAGSGARAPWRVAEPTPTSATPPPARLMHSPPVLASEFVVGPEDPPASLLTAARSLQEHGVRQFVVAAQTDARAQAAPNRSVELAALVQDRLATPAAARVTTWNRTIMGLQAHLLGAQAKGVSSILCESGYPVLTGDHPSADGTWEVDSIGLVEMLHALGEGFDHGGLPISVPSPYEILARVNVGAHDIDAECERALRKVKAGAQVLVTQPVFEAASLRRVLESVDGAVPLLATIRPLTSFAEAEFLRYEVPDVSIPDAIMSLIERAGPRAQEVGISLATDLADEVRDDVQGFVLRTTFHNAEAVRRVVLSAASGSG